MYYLWSEGVKVLQAERNPKNLYKIQNQTQVSKTRQIYAKIILTRVGLQTDGDRFK